MNNTENMKMLFISPQLKIYAAMASQKEMRHKKIGVEAHRILILLTYKRCCTEFDNEYCKGDTSVSSVLPISLPDYKD